MSQIIVKSTIKLSRNIDQYPFPAGLTFEASKTVTEDLIKRLNEIEKKSESYQMVGMDEQVKKVLFQQKYITENMIHNTIHSGLVLGEYLQYRINDEDHLTMICSDYRKPLSQLWDRVRSVEEILGHSLHYAFDLKLGYLTSRITEVGTGLKLSVILHLPGIGQTGYIDKLSQAVHQVGFALKSLAKDGEHSGCGLFELSNLVTIGKTEQELIESMEELIDRIAKKEQDAIDTLQSAQDKILEDDLYRAYGIVKYARILGYEESMDLLSKVRLGILLGYFSELSTLEIDELMFSIHPTLIEGKQNQIGRKGNIIRAEYIQAHIGQ